MFGRCLTPQEVRETCPNLAGKSDAELDAIARRVYAVFMVIVESQLKGRATC